MIFSGVQQSDSVLRIPPFSFRFFFFFNVLSLYLFWSIHLWPLILKANEILTVIGNCWKSDLLREISFVYLEKIDLVMG